MGVDRSTVEVSFALQQENGFPHFGIQSRRKHLKKISGFRRPGAVLSGTPRAQMPAYHDQP